jgi:thiamine pyrophosphate-dependent acetolactate synthase large subunit-like protein
MVAKTGVVKWFKQQLDMKAENDSLMQILSQYDLLNYTNQQVSTTFPRGGQIVRMAVAEGVIDKDSVNKQNKKEYREKLDSFMAAKGMRVVQAIHKPENLPGSLYQ